MRHLNKLASLFGVAALGLALTGCEGGDLYNIDSPDWIAERADSIANSKSNEPQEELEGMEEDVYTIGAPDFSTGWWAAFSKYYQIPDGETWNAIFNLNINPSASNTYKNFALILCNDEDRGAGNYKEYGAIRYDNQPSGNSEWGDYIDRDCVESNLTFGSDTDAGVEKLGGRITLTIDRSDPSTFVVKITNGTVTKTYKAKSALPNLNADESNNKIRAFLVPEGSCINFLQSNIEPIGGFTSAEDKLPLSLKLNGVPRKVLQGTELADFLANITATVDFEQQVSKTVSAEDLTIEVIPELSSLGIKTLVAAYNKTFKGENAPQPVIGYATFEVVDKMYTSIGATDNSTPFWGAHSEYVKVAPYETFVSNFTNFTSGISNWNNFCVVLTRLDASEYAVVRADNYGWGDGYGSCIPSGGQADWGAWLAAMDGAKVTTFVTNNGDGTADVKCVMLGTDGNTYYQDYIGIGGVDPEDFYFHFTVDGSHIEFDNVIGEEDNSTAFWGAHSEFVNVPAGRTYTQRFKNFTNGVANWNNFCVVLTRLDATEYAVVRADNYGWGDSYAACIPSGGQVDWAAWLAAMDEAMVTVSVTNTGDGTADVRCVMVGNDGNTYYQDYIGISPVDMEDFYFHFTVDGSHLIFE
jgi:hypothetical protein